MGSRPPGKSQVLIAYLRNSSMDTSGKIAYQWWPAQPSVKYVDDQKNAAHTPHQRNFLDLPRSRVHQL